MRKGRDPPCELPMRTVVLMKVQWGFAFFDVANNIFDMPVVCIHTNSMSPLQISQFDSASYDSMLCYCRT